MERHRLLRTTRRAPGRGGGGERLRVAIVAESFLPAVNGVTNSVLRIVEQLERAGHSALVVAPGPGEDRVGDTPVVRVRALDVPRAGPLRVGLPTTRVAAALRAFAPDVVHLAAPAVLGATGLRAARRLGLPTVAVYQTDLAGFVSRHGFAMAAERVWSWLSHLHRQADVTLAPSSAAVWALRAHGVEQVERWGRGVDSERFHPRHRSERLRHELAPRGEVLVGYVGRLAREKQIELLAPLAAHRGIRVVVVGDGPERDRLERALPRATFVGQRRGVELARYHASFDVFAHAGVDETFCQSIQEAMASGVPVVAPAAGGPLDLVRHGATGYLWMPDRPESLTEAVIDLARSPELRSTMGTTARIAVADRTWPVVVDELIDSYRSVLAVRAGGDRQIAA